MTSYRDSHGKALSDYEQPSLAVDTALLTVSPSDGLCVAVVEKDGNRRLPGAFVHRGQTLEEAVAASLAKKAGISGHHPRQLHVFDRPDRDDRGWVVSVAHSVVARFEGLPGNGLYSLVPIDRAQGLQFDHDEIVRLAVDWMRRRYHRQPDPSGLLPDEFTLRDLQVIHEAVAGDSLVRDTFRRSMISQLDETGRKVEGSIGKPARLFRQRRHSNHSTANR